MRATLNLVESIEPLKTKWTLQRKVGAGFVLVLIIVSFIQWFSYRSLVEFRNSADWVAHTHLVIGKINAVEGSLKDAEGAQRGYLLTGTPDFLALYNNAREDLMVRYGELDLLIKANRRHRGQMDAAHELILQRIALLDRVISVYDHQGPQASQNIVRQGRGQALSEQITEQLDQIQASERELLQARRNRAKDRSERVLSLLIFGGALVIGILWLVYFLVNSEISKRQASEAALSASEQRYALAALGTNDGIWDWDFDSAQMYLSPRWKGILGYEPHELADQPETMFERVHPDDLDGLSQHLSAIKQGHELMLDHTVRMTHKSGETVWVQIHGILARDDDGTPHRMVGSISDITLQKHYENKLLHQATHDGLTGLCNRSELMEQLNGLVSGAKRHHFALSLAMCDLDRFKHINDTYGHLVGDQVIIAFARIIREEIRIEDLAARFGGDEFCLVFPHTAAENVRHLLERVRQKLEETRFETADGTQFKVTGTFGIAEVTEAESAIQNGKDLIEQADLALYQAKQSRNSIAIRS